MARRGLITDLRPRTAMRRASFRIEQLKFS
jgi:hypothetical protein